MWSATPESPGSALIAPSTLRFRGGCPQAVASLRQSDPSLSLVVAEMLVARGISTPDQVRQFFNPTPEAIPSPHLFRDMDKAVEIIRDCLGQGVRVLVHGDYDCDGVCATTLLMEALQELGGEVAFHVPDRFQEGYGLSMKAVERCQEEGFGLLITVDCGSSSYQEVERCRELGIRVIVTDHHAVPEAMPRADAFINPQRPDCAYPFKGICGTGVAYKLVQALRGQSGIEPAHFLDLVALATVADVVPLVEENRAMVQLGLQQMGRARRPGISALLEVAGHTGRDVVDAFTVGFTLGPRLNAAGRLEHAQAGVELLLSRSVSQSRELASHLDRLNEARKECEKDIQDEIERRLESDPSRLSAGAIVEWGEGWHQGVIGITAGRLAEKYGLPTLVIATDGPRAKGSGRSPENVDLYQALKRCAPLFEKFGGHPRAGGFSLAAADLPALREQFCQAAAELRDGPAPVWVDGCLTLAEANLDLVRELERLEPFGEANPKPTFLLEGLDIVNRRLVGRNGDHLQLEVEQVGLRRRAIAFRQADLVDHLETQSYRYDLRCQIGREVFRGADQIKLQVTGIVRPPALSVNEQGPVWDLRHVRTRKRELARWLEREEKLLVVCRDPGQAEESYPAFRGRFVTYDSVQREADKLLFLAPPSTVQEFVQTVESHAPRGLVFLFGCQEVERNLQLSARRGWGRETAVRLWQLLRKVEPSTLTRSVLRTRAGEELRLAADTVDEILSAFQETGALSEQAGRLVLGQSNGLRLEETRAYRQQRERRKQGEEVRRFFAGPDLSSRLCGRWPELHSRS